MTEEASPLIEGEEESVVVKEMYDLDIPRVDVVKGPASGRRFIVLKAGQPQDPDAIAAVRKAEKSTASMNDAPDEDFAYIEPGGTKDESGKTTPRSKRHFYIGDADHVRNALARASQSPFGDKAMPKIRAAAKKFGIDVSKAKEAGMTEPTSPTATDTEPVKKADGDLDAGELLAEPDGGADGSATAPSSSAWESVDAATARKWTAILARAKSACELLFDRESQEAALGDDGDAEDAWNLEDACAAIDYAISVLATHAAGEQAEADMAQEALDGVAKAMANFKAEDLEMIEGLLPVKKAGRVLSAANEQAIRDAVSSLQKVLSSLPAAPEAVAKALKEAKAAKVTKAKGDPMVPVYDANGKLCGMVDATDIVPIADAPGADKEPSPAPPEDGKEVAGADGQPAGEPNGAATAAPAEPAPQQQAVAKSQLPQTPEELAELIRTEVASAVKARDEDHTKVVKSLEDRLEKIEKQPAPRGPLLSSVPLGGLQQVDGGHLALRGQTQPEGDAELERIQKALEATKDPVEIASLLQEQSTRRLAIALGKK